MNNIVGEQQMYVIGTRIKEISHIQQRNNKILSFDADYLCIPKNTKMYQTYIFECG